MHCPFNQKTPSRILSRVQATDGLQDQEDILNFEQSGKKKENTIHTQPQTLRHVKYEEAHFTDGTRGSWGARSMCLGVNRPKHCISMLVAALLRSGRGGEGLACDVENALTANQGYSVL